jgi:hypothetical protein
MVKAPKSALDLTEIYGKLFRCPCPNNPQPLHIFQRHFLTKALIMQEPKIISLPALNPRPSNFSTQCSTCGMNTLASPQLCTSPSEIRNYGRWFQKVRIYSFSFYSSMIKKNSALILNSLVAHSHVLDLSGMARKPLWIASTQKCKFT